MPLTADGPHCQKRSS